MRFLLVWVGFWLVWWGCFAVCRAPSLLLPSFVRGLPLFGKGHPFLQQCRPARFCFLLYACTRGDCLVVSWVLVGFGFVVWVGCLFFGSGLGLAAGGYHGYLESFLLQSTGDCHASVDAPPFTWEGPLCPLASVPGLGFLPFDLVVLPFVTF